MDFHKPFEGLTVIELASVLAGPAVGMFFAELGAKVIKIENPRTGGDVTRQWKSVNENAEEKTSAYYNSVNWGKEIHFIDISTIEGRKNLDTFLVKADVLILNFKSGDAEKFGLDYESLSAFPKLIYAHISGYGENDPRPAFDLVMQAESGFMSMNGTTESGPLKMPVAIIDLMAAHQLKEGILTALYLREKTGKGSCVHVSLFDSAISSLANQASNYLVTNKNPGLDGSLHPNIAPYGETFRCKDNRYLVLAVGNDRQFKSLCESLGIEEIFNNPKFSTNQSRVVNRKELFALLQKHFYVSTSAEIIISLTRNAVPHALVKSVAEALSSENIKSLILEKNCVKTTIFGLRN